MWCNLYKTCEVIVTCVNNCQHLIGVSFEAFWYFSRLPVFSACTVCVILKVLVHVSSGGMFVPNVLDVNSAYYSVAC